MNINNQPANNIALNPDGTVNMDILNQELSEAGHDGLYPPVSRMDNKTENFHSYEEAQQAIENRKAANRHNKASPIQANDTISDIINSEEYKQTLDYIRANNIGNLPNYQTHDHLGINPDAEQHNIINPLEIFINNEHEPEVKMISIMDNDIKLSKPVNIATNEPKTEDIDMPAKKNNPMTLPKLGHKSVRPNPQITPACVLDGYTDPIIEQYNRHQQPQDNNQMNTDNDSTNDKPAYTSFGEQWEDDMMNDDATPQHVNVLQDKVTPIQDFDNIVSLNTPTNDMPANRDISHIKGMGFDVDTTLTMEETDKAYNHTQPPMPTPEQSDADFDEWCESADMVHAHIEIPKTELVDVDSPESQYELSQAVDSNQYDYMFDRQYQITATGRQVDDLSFACETMARIEIGQMNAIIDALPLKGDTDTYALLHQIEYLLKPYLKPNLPHSPFFTMHQSLRHRRSWDIHPEGGMTVNFDEPLILDSKTPLLDVVLVEHDLTQDIFKGQPHHILSAHIDENGTAMLNQCNANELTVHQGKHISLVADVWQYPVGKGYKTDNWQASPINRVF